MTHLTYVPIDLNQMPLFAPLFLTHPDWKPIFAPNGRLLEEGEIIRNVNYSKTLATVATQGVDAFYKGPIADALIEKIREGAPFTFHKHQDVEAAWEDEGVELMDLMPKQVDGIG